jgi:hypothetical protein
MFSPLRDDYEMTSPNSKRFTGQPDPNKTSESMILWYWYVTWYIVLPSLTPATFHIIDSLAFEWDEMTVKYRILSPRNPTRMFIHKAKDTVFVG